jgi:uncharacterized protein (DUF2249 family)
MKDLEKKLFANELALKNLENSKSLMNISDTDPAYLQTKYSIEFVFEKHKQEYKELTGTDYINLLK